MQPELKKLQKKLDTRSKILAISSDLFMKCGLRSVSIDDICTHLHISKKTFYAHFSTKDELVEQLLAQMRSERVQLAESNSRSENAIDHAIRELNALRNNPNEKAFSFYYDLRKYYPELLERHECEVRETVYKYLCISVRNGIAQGLFREDTNVEATVVLLHSHIFETISDLKRYAQMSISEVVMFIADTFFRIITTPCGWEYYLNNKNKIK